MARPHLSIRVDPSTLERLDRASRRAGTSRSDLAKTLIEEGLRMAAHPGVIFKPGPAGRRPALIAGPDIWELITVFRDFKREKDPGKPHGRVDVSEPDGGRDGLSYYAAFADEIDEWIHLNAEESEEAETAWREQRRRLSE